MAGRAKWQGFDRGDAVPASEKAKARQRLGEGLDDLPVPVFMRINATDIEWFADDPILIQSADIGGITPPKVETANGEAAVGRNFAVIGLFASAPPKNHPLRYL